MPFHTLDNSLLSNDTNQHHITLFRLVKKVWVDILWIQYSLFEIKSKSESKEITDVIDALNNKFGKNKVKVATVGNREKDWALIKEHRSPRFTTNWDELLTVGKKNKSSDF